MSNPLKPIRLKFKQGVKVNDAVQALNQHSTEYPQNFLTEVKNIGQSATGQSDYNIGANESQTGTLGEANLMAGAGNKRVRQKIQNMEQEGLAPVLEQWLAGIAQFYTDEIDYLLNDGLEAGVKFIPYGRNINNNAKMVAEYAVREGVLVENVKTVEDVFKAKGYEVVFISDIIGGYDIAIKTSLAALDRQQMLQDYDRAIAKAIAANQESLAMGQPPEWDVNKLTEESFRQFPEIIEDVNDYKLAPEVAGMMQQAVQAKALMGQKPIQQEKPATGPGGPANS